MTNTAKVQAARAPAPAAPERRVWVRYLCDLPTSCHPILDHNDQCWSGRVQNISRGGVNLVVSRRFEAGTLLQIEIQGPNDPEPNRILARVVHARRDNDEQWSLGCAFPWALSEDALRALLEVSDPTMA